MKQKQMLASESGGETGIRTLGGVTPTTVFETAPFDRSGISPLQEPLSSLRVKGNSQTPDPCKFLAPFFNGSNDPVIKARPLIAGREASVMWHGVFAGGMVVFALDIEPPHDGLRGRPLRCLRRTLRIRRCAALCGMQGRRVTP